MAAPPQSAPDFFYDFVSPYAYLAVMRVDDVLPVEPVWRPIAFGPLLQELGKIPWSFRAEERPPNFAEIATRAEARGLPPVRYPRGWPRETYSLAPARAALVAAETGRLKEVSRELYRAIFVEGREPNDPATTLDAAARAGLERAAVEAGIERPEIKERLRAQTDAALARGVTGIPTLAVGERLFWGDDRLEEAAALLAA